MNELYTYDQMNQLTAMQRGVLNTAGDTVSSKTFGEQFMFDMTGNWLNYKQDANGDGAFEVNQTRTHNTANEIQTISGGNTLVSYDRNGCMTKVPKPLDNATAYTLVYDAWNRLVQVKSGTAVVATYVYDARNHRIKTTVGDETRLYYFNQQWQCVEERVGTTVDATWIYGLRYIDDVIMQVKTDEMLYAIQDTNWNVYALLNASGVVQERITYDSFGKPTFRNANFTAKTASSYGWSKTFTGQVYDVETGLLLYRNRYYHTGLGRFITRDPIGYRGDGSNLYRYVKNNTWARYDTYGFKEVCGPDVWFYTGLGWCVEQNVWDAAMGAAGDSVNENPIVRLPEFAKAVVDGFCELAKDPCVSSAVSCAGDISGIAGSLPFLPKTASIVLAGVSCFSDFFNVGQAGCSEMEKNKKMARITAATYDCAMGLLLSSKWADTKSSALELGKSIVSLFSYAMSAVVQAVTENPQNGLPYPTKSCCEAANNCL